MLKPCICTVFGAFSLLQIPTTAQVTPVSMVDSAKKASPTSPVPVRLGSRAWCVRNVRRALGIPECTSAQSRKCVLGFNLVRGERTS